MHNWNVVFTLYESHFRQTKEFLETIGRVGKTDYFNVLVMKVDDIDHFLEEMKKYLQAEPNLDNMISRVMPASVTFDFQTPAEFETRVIEAVEPLAQQLSGNSFYVRMHRRGFKDRLSSQDEEQMLDRFLKEKLDEQGTTGSIDFDDPDYIIDIETVGQRAGIGIWTREQRLLYPFLKLD